MFHYDSDARSPSLGAHHSAACFLLVLPCVTVLVTNSNVLKQATRIYNQLAAEVLKESAATSISTQLMEGIGGTSGGSVCR